MHCTEHQAATTRLLQPLAAAVLGVAGLLLLPAANAQMGPNGSSASRAISLSDHSGREAECSCRGHWAGDQHQAEL